MEIKKIMLNVCCLLCYQGFVAAEDSVPYIIQRGGETLIVSNMPKFVRSDPVTNSFVYIDGEYIVPPYIVSVSNLSVCINGRTVTNYEPWVNRREWYLPRRVGITPETVARSVDFESECLVKNLLRGGVLKYYKGGKRSSGGDDGDGLALIKLARKAMQGSEQAKRELIKEMGLENSLSKVRPDWIQRLANNTNLEIRATRILESKRLKEQKEKERREQQNPQDKR